MRCLLSTGVSIALPALDGSRRTAILDALNSLAGRLNASSPVLALVLRSRLSMLAQPQNFYPAECADLPFLDERTAASWLEASATLLRLPLAKGVQHNQLITCNLVAHGLLCSYSKSSMFTWPFLNPDVFLQPLAQLCELDCQRSCAHTLHAAKRRC